MNSSQYRCEPATVVLASRYEAFSGRVSSASDLGVGDVGELAERAHLTSVLQGNEATTFLDPDFEIKKGGEKSVYQEDDRLGIVAVPDKALQKIAAGVATISKHSRRRTELQGFCTAFLIATDRV